MQTSSILAGLLPQLNTALLERTGEGTFSLIGEPPAWFSTLWPEAVVQRTGLHPEAHFLFLEVFMPDADALWQSQQDEMITSSLWTERDVSGKEWLLEASAMYQTGRAFLLLKFPTVPPETYRQLLQQSRELSLEHYHLQKEIDRREIFLHCLVHDLSTPLASIKGSLRLLNEEGMVIDAGKPLIQIGLRQTERLGQMVRDMLAPALGQASASTELPTAFPDLAEKVDDLVTSMTPTAQLKDIRLAIIQEPETQAAWRVVAQANRLERVLFNLIENALRHAPAESEVIVRLQDEQEQVYVCVEDAGTGVPVEQIPALFKKFSQGAHQKGVAGLGLYYCRITIEGWGGQIGYSPAPQGGACFWFRLPKPHSPL